MVTVIILRVSKAIVLCFLLLHLTGCKMLTEKNEHNKIYQRGNPTSVIILPDSRDSVLFDNLRFSKLIVLDEPSEKTYLYEVTKFYFKYKNKTFVSNHRIFSSENLNQIFQDKPSSVQIDSVLFRDQHNFEYKQRADILLNLYYSNSNLYECLDTNNHNPQSYKFKDFSKKDGGALIELDSELCNIIDFGGLGSSINVRIETLEGDVLKASFIYWGKRKIDDFFEFSNYVDSTLKVKITGDLFWEGTLNFR
ncbi:MAG: hypothetical protein V4638_09285 [Bacteroidota bacterium]